MKDLLVYTADADAQAFMRSLLGRCRAIGIRELSFHIERHPQRDAGMVQSGAELVRMNKGRYRRVLLMWDHHGSGREHRHTPTEIETEICDKLDRFTWSGNHAVVVLIPELEQWLWYCESAVAAHCAISTEQLGQWVEERAARLGVETNTLKQTLPKELFEYIMRERLRRTISPRDFEEIGKRASIRTLMQCSSFQGIIAKLAAWFPLQEEQALGINQHQP
jgi:hypothetical protein